MARACHTGALMARACHTGALMARAVGAGGKGTSVPIPGARVILESDTRLAGCTWPQGGSDEARLLPDSHACRSGWHHPLAPPSRCVAGWGLRHWDFTHWVWGDALARGRARGKRIRWSNGARVRGGRTEEATLSPPMLTRRKSTMLPCGIRRTGRECCIHEIPRGKGGWGC